jgi:uncharacterized surface protein with fasciclin (FAS1) repeats
VNQSKTTPEALLQDEALAEEVIANHMLIGEEIRLQDLKTDQKRHTAGGQPLVFKVDKNGELTFAVSRKREILTMLTEPETASNARR